MDRVVQTWLDLLREDQPMGQAHKVVEAQNGKELDQDLQEDSWACNDDHGKGQKVPRMEEHMTREDGYSDEDGQGEEDSPVRASNKKRSKNCNKQTKFIKTLWNNNEYHIFTTCMFTFMWKNRKY